MRLRALMFVVLGAKDCVLPVQAQHPPADQSPAHTLTPWSPPAPATGHHAEALPLVRRTVRLHPDHAWEASTTPNLDIDDLFVLPDVEWPDRPAAQMLHDGLSGRSDAFSEQHFLHEADTEGLLEHPPSSYDDEWDRYVALWSMYVQVDWDTDGMQQLGQELQRAYARTPDGPTTDAIAVGILLTYTDTNTDLAHEVALDLLDSEDPGIQSYAVTVALSDPRNSVEAMLPWLDTPETMRLGLTWAMEHSDWDTAEQLATALAEHPDSTELDTQDATDVGRLLEPEPEHNEPWFTALSDEIRGCADLVAGESVRVSVVGAQWQIHSEGPASDCLQGWSFEAPAMDLELRITR
jgi:hypothetical protein